MVEEPVFEFFATPVQVTLHRALRQARGLRPGRAAVAPVDEVLPDVFRTQPRPLEVRVDQLVPERLVHLDEVRDGDDLQIVLPRDRDEVRNTLHLNEPPDLPGRLSPGQAAQISEILEFFHLRLRNLISDAMPEKKTEKMTLEPRHWQELIDLQAHLAEYLRGIGDPEHGVK